jgi:hypothetical protein
MESTHTGQIQAANLAQTTSSVEPESGEFQIAELTKARISDDVTVAPLLQQVDRQQDWSRVIPKYLM